MKNKRIAVIGNSPVGQLLTLMLDGRYEVVRVTDCEKKPECIPFYANDIERGILKQFCIIAGIPFQDAAGGRPRMNIALDSKRQFCFESSYVSFREKILKHYPQYREAVKRLFLDIKGAGEEWSTFIKNNFDPAGARMKTSAKYAGMTVDKYLGKIGLLDSDIRRIMHAVLPVGDVTFPVFAGYLYTQFFDNHILRQNIWEEIDSLAEERGSCICLDDLKSAAVEDAGKESGGKLVLENADGVIDLRCLDLKEGQTENTRKQIWEGFCGARGLDDKVIYHAKTEEGILVRLWKSLYAPARSKNQWQFELLAEKKDGFDAGAAVCFIKEKMREYYDADIEIDLNSVYAPEYLEKHYDSACGYRWAFNAKQAMEDPVNLYKRQKSPYIKCGYWGFAWLSAAFFLYHAVEKQVEWGGKYKIIQQ